MNRRSVSISALAISLLLPSAAALAQQAVAGGLAVQVAPHAYVVSDQGRNLVLIADSAGAMVAGVQAPALVAKARQALAALHAGPVRYALLMDGPGAPGFLDGGWEGRGALALAHEGLRGQIRAAVRDTVTRAPAGTRLPSMGYSEVVQVQLGGEEAHCVKQHPGYSRADAAIHFEGAGLLYLNSLTMDGYPDIDVAHGGTLAGMAETAAAFATNFASFPEAIEPIVPARGPLASIRELGEFRDMLIAVHDRVEKLLDEGKTVDQAVAAHPTADLDARWGRGPVTPERFVRTAYAAIQAERAAEAEERAHSH
ncbi:hypothetical protein [Longimicrobium sp.]|uniref:hypothetical protein n=1 Tax=Longimicrobium sp. TaxID=2029185 RepID=UPI002CDD99F2|nr:hypothetical protein [Longimicrobium sp.]HSU13349.1 hypothetical protein [Longimicrobium sp.]